MDHSFIKVSGDEERAVKRGMLGVLVLKGGGGVGAVGPETS